MSKPEIPQKASIPMKMEAGTYYWCACGKSSTQPFCDGSHQGTEFTPEQVVIEEEKMVAWCACKHSNGKPFCDGTHNTL